MKEGPWLPEEDALALRYLNEGKSLAEVGKILGRSRIAVIGRSNRKKWDYLGKKSKTGLLKKQIKAPVKKYKPRTVRSEGTTLLDNARNDQCRFVIGEARARMCCDQKAIPGHSWCPIHAPIVYGITTPALRRLIERHSQNSKA